MRFTSLIAVLLIFSSAMSAWGSGTGTMYIIGGSVSGTGTISGIVDVRAAGSITPGAPVGTLPIDGTLDISTMAATGGSGTLSFGLGSLAGTNDKITVSALTIGSGELDLGDFNFDPLSGFQVGTYTLITSTTNISGTLAGSNLSGAISGTNNDYYTATLAISVDNKNIILKISQTYAQWDDSYGPNLSNMAGDNDGDGPTTLPNLLEFAFGTDPTVASAAVMSYVAGGAVTPGLPTPINLQVGPGVDYRAIFCRRKDYVAAGLTYTVQFSADLSTWTSSGTSPTILSNPNSSGPVDAVSVPYPWFIPIAGGGNAKARFFQVVVTAP